MKAPRILIIEDENQIRRFVRIALEAENFDVIEADSGTRGLIEASTRQPDLVIVDLGLPDLEGKEVIRQIRGWSEMPIVVLSARDREEEKVAALDIGADDYLTKPFGMPELIARIRAHLRRRQSNENQGDPIVHFGDVIVDLAAHAVTRSGVDVHLTPIEYRLLLSLINVRGRVVTHNQLMLAVWGPNYSERSHYLRVYMGHLRQKLEHNPAQPEFLLTELGVGYRLV
ncbi:MULTISPECIES: response regulator [Nitrosomonas]|uniref:Two-component system, OmpR family, KDP operon response regulator KdpE n=1 Tax=Nitrosomonas oligotropha TaxID=42354 RepID=A0A1H8TLB1_9PROT|nr:response regulator [Nitrosomonas oligotropha]SDX32159.1 two-component system, OmpR family, KDP operon response regulator KdpE [Nitrosomonas oligotropha]SEO91268.1 two-component system, OmpR family, KDP operon response regulator KdpE [Nitrosomonas oligotropha]